MSEEASNAAIVRRVLPASIESIYAEWLDPDALAEFLAPAPATTTILECDPRVGGHLILVMQDGDFIVNISGRYLELDPPRRLSFSWDSDMAPGFSSIVTVTLEALSSEETLMTIEHRPIPSQLLDDHQLGWQAIAEQLAKRAAKRRGFSE